MSPEAREKYEKDLKRVKRNRRIVAGVAALLLAAVAAAALSMTVFFTVSAIKVTNKSVYYSEKEIISASGLSVGDNMIKHSPEDAAERIEAMLPYILKADVKKSLSGNITITVKDNKASVIFPVKGGQALADYEGKVLELIAEAPEKNNYIVLKTKAQLSGNPGEKIKFSDENEESAFNDIIKALKDCGLIDSITGIDISEMTNVRIEYQHRMRIKVGGISELDAKLSAAAKAIELENESNPKTIAEINATIPKKIYVDPVETLDEEALAAAQAAAEEEERLEEEEEKKKEAEEEAEENSEEKTEEQSGEEKSEAEDSDEAEEETDENSENESENDENKTEEE